MARSTFNGPVRSLNGFISTGNNMAQVLAAGTVDGGTDVVGIDKYQGKTTQFVDATTVFNLPEIVLDTGSDAQINSPNTTSTIGLKYSFLCTETLAGGNTFTLNCGTAAGRATADVFYGAAWSNNTNTDPGVVTAWAVGSSGYDTITLNGTTKGGVIGTLITVEAVAANLWSIDARLISVGALADPWS